MCRNLFYTSQNFLLVKLVLYKCMDICINTKKLFLENWFVTKIILEVKLFTKSLHMVDLERLWKLVGKWLLKFHTFLLGKIGHTRFHLGNCLENSTSLTWSKWLKKKTQNWLLAHKVALIRSLFFKATRKHNFLFAQKETFGHWTSSKQEYLYLLLFFLANLAKQRFTQTRN